MNKDIIWLIRGYQRKALFENIPEKPFLSNKLRKELNEQLNMNLSLREVSRHLNDFSKRKLLLCLNPSDPYNRIYKLTNEGKNIKKKISMLEL